MKHKLKIIFEQDPNVEDLEVRIRAKEPDEEVEALMNRIKGETTDQLTVTSVDGTYIKINPSDIVSVSVNGKLVQIITENERFTVRQSLQRFEENLEELRFVRISRYEIINLDKVLKFDFTLGGTLRLELVGGMETWASRRNIPLIRKKLTEGE